MKQFKFTKGDFVRVKREFPNRIDKADNMIGKILNSTRVVIQNLYTIQDLLAPDIQRCYFESELDSVTDIEVMLFLLEG